MGKQDKILQQGHRQCWTLAASLRATMEQGVLQGGVNASPKHTRTLTEDLLFLFFFKKRRPNPISEGLT